MNIYIYINVWVCVYVCLFYTPHAATYCYTDDKKVICYIFVVIFLIYYFYKLFISPIPISPHNEFQTNTQFVFTMEKNS